MKIIVDAMGGDNAPKEVVLGALEAVKNLAVDVVLVGNEEKIRYYMATPVPKIEVVNAAEVIGNDEPPVAAIRTKKDASIPKGLKLLKEGRGNAMVSAGSTGALMAGGLFILGRFEGVDRPAIATLVPTRKKPTLLLDIGANSDSKPRNLVQFAVMGSVYSREILGVENPRVGLLNIGVEEEKGNSAVKTAYGLLRELKDINFGGNVEARDFFDGHFDVVVCDGFVGNIFLKTVEGFGSFLLDLLKTEVKGKFTYSLGALLIKPALKAVKARMDYSEYGGAMFLGLDGILIKCHGSSDRKAIFNGIKLAKQFAESNVHLKLKKALLDIEGEISS
ncbi:phosphate acyltransferase PlsX [Thermosediminibacter oceani]|uniref:Phosphate acyltransferase n=1 Tax=Thermosediminibacter oceani (strain ATCC BAA-1034 / DSM 16646 / JW/IW-1228P) TaxID=555079 RepID=D9S337_THEOJ|nr:phosphate acyltransferase PlsX [Thermosediminibacter oceani]ADL07814.1 phosphate:acyl-(acyl carrier protein) acyltransferase [Thermosediminibacter oceani DSM 16646]